VSWIVAIKLAWIRTARVWDRIVLAVFQRALFRSLRPNDNTIQRIVVYRIGNIGDILVTLPTLAAIRDRFPTAHITLLTSPGQKGAPGAADLLPMGKWHDGIIVYFLSEVQDWQGRRKLLANIRESRFDLFVQLPNQQSRTRDELRNMLFARLAGCRKTAGFAVSQQGYFLREQTLHIPQIQEARRIFDSVVRPLGLGRYSEVLLPVSARSRSRVAELLRRRGISSDEPFVVLHAGAKRQTNQWPSERYATVADEIIRKWRAPVVLTGSNTELPIIRDIVSAMTEPVTSVCGEIDLDEMIALLELASLYIGNDTGPMHLAAAVGTPTVSIFSARDFPERWRPMGTPHTVLRHDAPCSPCFKETCDRNMICIKAIGVEEVTTAISQTLIHLETARKNTQWEGQLT